MRRAGTCIEARVRRVTTACMVYCNFGEGADTVVDERGRGGDGAGPSR